MTRLLIIILFAITTAAVAPADEATSLAGKWNLHYNIGGYEGDLGCVFTQNEKAIAGTCKNDQSTVSVTGNVDGKAVTLQYKTEYNGDELTVVYTGKAESATKIAGSVNVQPVGADGDFTATAAK